MHALPADQDEARAAYADGLAPLAELYDAFLIDQWGVLHDGMTPYQGADAALAGLAERGKPVVIISNSGRRAADNEVELARMGVGRGLYASVLTPGEMAWQELAARRAAGEGMHAMVVGGNAGCLAQSGVTETADETLARLVILAGPDARLSAPEARAETLRRWKALDLPILCTNPDLVCFVKGTPQPGPGAAAADYERLGGAVRYLGKPHPEIYREAVLLLGEGRRVLCIGDSPHHDIAGARRAGLDSALVATGVARPVFGEAAAPADLVAQANALEPGMVPTWVMPSLRW